MPTDRQPPAPACRAGMMAALTLGGLLWALPAQGELSVALGLPAPGAPAPLALTVTASVAGDDPVLEYAWEGLDAWPPCAVARCPLTLGTAGCRRIAVEVTGLSGASARAEAIACAHDPEGAAPTARVRLAAHPQGQRVGREVQPGGAEVRVQRLFVDGVEALDGEVVVLDDGGCHDVDLLVVDAAGRTGEDHRQVCFRDDAPRPRLFADPGRMVVQDDLQALCGDHRHPLGLELSTEAGVAVPAHGCEDRTRPPVVFGPMATTVVDPAGVRATATLWVGKGPDEAPYTLPWVAFPATVGLGQNEGEILGGAPPFRAVGWVELEEGGAGELTVSVEETRKLSFIVPDFQVSGAHYVVRVQVTDARGLATEARARARIEPPAPDAGVRVDSGFHDPGPVGLDSAACAALGVEGAAPLLMLLAGWPLWSRRRRR
jgi:hypothetical protein